MGFTARADCKSLENIPGGVGNIESFGERMARQAGNRMRALGEMGERSLERVQQLLIGFLRIRPERVVSVWGEWGASSLAAKGTRDWLWSRVNATRAHHSTLA